MNRLIALFTVAILAFVMPVESQARGGGGGRHSWGGSSHTSSHGGTYIGGVGSFHRGGHYVGPYGGYGTHK